MPAHLLSVVRSASRLSCLVHDSRGPADPAKPWAVEYASELRAFETRSNPRLWTAWCALANVTAWDQDTLAHVLVVLDESVPDASDADGTLPALGPFVLPSPPPKVGSSEPSVAYRTTANRAFGPPSPCTPTTTILPSGWIVTAKR